MSFKKLYDFRCEKGHVTEKLVDPAIKYIRCECGREATRIISSVNFTLDGSKADFPTAHDQWVRRHEKAGKLTKKLHNT